MTVIQKKIKMKSKQIIFQDFSIAGIKKQYDWQNTRVVTRDLGGGVKELVTSMKDLHEASIGCKTETRRLTGLKEINKNPNDYSSCKVIEKDGRLVAVFYDHGEKMTRFTNKVKYDGLARPVKYIKCPYGVKGDELWVREKYLFDEPSNKYEYFADASEWEQKSWVWKNVLYMPRKASRITLINEGVTVERLHSITEEGAIREGVLPLEDGLARLGYEDAWKQLHGQESWDLNPFCWVLKFSVKEFKQ